jgi:DNA-binding NtrC family response regulator
MGSCVLILGTRLAVCTTLATALGHDGFEVDLVTDEREAVERSDHYDVVVADISAAVIPLVKARSPHTEVVVLAPAARVDDALAAVHQGAFDFVLEPFLADDVSLTVACAAAQRRGTAIGSALAFVRKNVDLLR